MRANPKSMVFGALCLAVGAVTALAGPAAADPTSESSKPDATAASPSTAPATSAQPQTTPVTIAGPNGTKLRCREQGAQPFLVRGNWFKGDGKAGQKMFADSIRFRTEKYGHFPGFGSPSSNAHPPRFYAKSTTFMGLAVSVNEHIIPALACVEAALKQSGADQQYHPKSMGGIRFQNTYRGSEISNHVYGIAVDIEPQVNTCCGCVRPWNDHPLCKKKVQSIFERMAMPKSWVDVFERYGFYWLGHDVLQDTMHFEFLGDPDAITEPAAAH